MRFLIAIVFLLAGFAQASPEPTHQKIIIDGSSYAFGSSALNTYYYLSFPEKFSSHSYADTKMEKFGNVSAQLFPAGCSSPYSPVWELKHNKFLLRELSICGSFGRQNTVRPSEHKNLPVIADWITGSFVVELNELTKDCVLLNSEKFVTAKFYEISVVKGLVSDLVEYTKSVQPTSRYSSDINCK